MNILIDLYNFIKAHWTEIVAAYTAMITALWLTSEVLAQIPSVKSNSVFQLVYNWLEKKKR